MGYLIYYGKGTVRNRTIITPSDANTYTVTGLSAFTYYTFAVTGMNQVSSGPSSEVSDMIRTAEDRE